MEQLKPIIESLKYIVSAMKGNRLSIEDILNVQLTVEEINTSLYHAKQLKFQRQYDLESSEGYFGYVRELETMIALWEQSISCRAGFCVDIDFWDIYEYFKYVDQEVIYERAVERFLELPENLKLEFLTLQHKFTFLQGSIDDQKNDFSLLRHHIDVLAMEIENYKWLYERLADNRSKIILNGIIRYWIEFNVNQLRAMRETIYQPYQDLDIVFGNEMDVVVDVGAAKGDFTLDYIHNFGICKKMYAYESDPEVHRMLMRDMFIYPNVVTAAKKLGAEQNPADMGQAVFTLDAEIKEPITILKIDLQGQEKEALIGAAQHIKMDKPKLILPVCYQPERIFELPCMIHEMREDYKFYLRYYGLGTIWPDNYALFAI